jgi:hypothetical protein
LVDPKTDFMMVLNMVGRAFEAVRPCIAGRELCGEYARAWALRAKTS